jgi:hypothetical protein
MATQPPPALSAKLQNAEKIIWQFITKILATLLSRGVERLEGAMADLDPNNIAVTLLNQMDEAKSLDEGLIPCEKEDWHYLKDIRPDAVVQYII